MTLNHYRLEILYFTQNRYSGDPEVAVAPTEINSEQNLHVYMMGLIPADRSVLLRTVRMSGTGSSAVVRESADPRTPGQLYKSSLPHYTLSGDASYLLKAIDDVNDPWVIVSHEIKTILIADGDQRTS